ncbi:hypothetical protein GWL_29710 [Herbaspirillum sp. GW103]|nr:hypothetical protein GWL_29710 [Herbaspirillum sp. GW103]
MPDWKIHQSNKDATAQAAGLRSGTQSSSPESAGKTLHFIAHYG